MMNIRIYWAKHQLRCDGNYYDQLFMETKSSICILLERMSKQQ